MFDCGVVLEIPAIVTIMIFGFVGIKIVHVFFEMFCSYVDRKYQRKMNKIGGSQ